MAKKLTKNQQIFVDEYVKDRNSRRAALSSGCTLSTSPPSHGWYVYFLVDPRSQSIFYVGKGKNGRMFSHSRKTPSHQNPFKEKRIEEIGRCGQAFISKVFAAFDVESDAFACERELISSLWGFGITNITGGSVSEIEKIRTGFQAILDKLKTKQQWIDSIPREIKKEVVQEWDSLGSFYDRFRSRLVEGVQYPEHFINEISA